MKKTLPWEYCPALTGERLSSVARMLRDARRDTHAEHRPEKGDRPWGFGCRSYERQMHAVRVGTERYEWLTIVNDSLEFIFAIGGVPCRFYKGSPEKTEQHKMRRTFAELRYVQGSLLPSFEDDARTFSWRFAVVTDEYGLAEEVILVAFRPDESIAVRWSIPFGEAEDAPPPIPLLPPPVPIGPPVVKAPSASKKSGENDGS